MYGLRARCAAQLSLIVGMLLRASNFVYPVHLYRVQVYRVQGLFGLSDVKFPFMVPKAYRVQVYRVQVYRVQGTVRS
jgi:hypothetical protein